MPLIDLNGLAHFKDKENEMIAADYTAAKTYAVGEYVYYNGVLYRCNTEITTAEAWTAGHWTAAKLADDLSSQGVMYDGAKYSHKDVLNSRLLASSVNEPPSLDSIAFGTTTYRDLFVTNNMASNGSFTNGSYSPATSNAGSPTITQEAYSSEGYSLKAFGTSSTQIKWSNLTFTQNHYYAFGCMVKVDRYVKGSCGVSVSFANYAAAQNETTTGFVYASEFLKCTSTKAGNGVIYAGTISSANADCYVDDVYCIDVTNLFDDLDITTAIGQNAATARICEYYLNYIDILNGKNLSKSKYYSYRKPKFVTAIMDGTTDDRRFLATRYLLRIAENKLLGLDTSTYERRLKRYASMASVCILPETPSMYQKQGFDLVYSYNGTTSALPASITKVVTIITALPYISSIKTKYTIDADDLRTGSGNVFQAGDVVTLEDLMYAMMLPSSNTAATALAHYVGAIILDDPNASEADCEAAFVAEMAKVVSSIGCTDSTFTTPSGLSANGVHSSTTCIDILKIGIEAASWDVLNRIWNNDTYTIQVNGTNARTINISTTVVSQSLEDAYMILGGKTGAMTDISPEAYTLLAITEPK